MPKASNSGFRGVYRDAHRDRFRVTVCDPSTGKFIHGGYYQTAEEAARRWDDMIVELYGSTGAVPFLNFPREAREKETKRKAAVSDMKAKPADGATVASR